LGEEVKITVLGVTALEPTAPLADVAPAADEVLELTAQAKQSHPSKLEVQKSRKDQTKKHGNRLNKRRKDENQDQNTFSFMEEQNQRGIFDDLPNKNIYEGEDLDVPAYLRRGVQISI